MLRPCAVRVRPLVLLVAAVLLALLPAGPARAHTALAGSTPADGAAVPAPREVVLSFSGALVEGLSVLAVTGPDGADGAAGEPELRAAGEGAELVQPLANPPAPGRWEVAYRVVAADGHPLTGTRTFTVTGTVDGPADPTATPTATLPPAPEAADAAPPLDPVADEGGGAGLLLGLALAAALVLGALVLARRRAAAGRG